MCTVLLLQEVFQEIALIYILVQVKFMLCINIIFLIRYDFRCSV